MLAGQYLEQIEIDQVKAAVFGNCGNFCCFRVSNDDAEKFAPTLEQQVSLLEDLPTGKAAIKYLENGHPTTARIVTDPLHPNDYVGRSVRVKKAAKRYTTPIDQVITRHIRWTQTLKQITSKS